MLDKSAVVGQRMKSAFIRSKRNAAALMDVPSVQQRRISRVSPSSRYRATGRPQMATPHSKIYLRIFNLVLPQRAYAFPG